MPDDSLAELFLHNANISFIDQREESANIPPARSQEADAVSRPIPWAVRFAEIQRTRYCLLTGASLNRSGVVVCTRCCQGVNQTWQHWDTTVPG
jgi:hypothetical protein